MNTALVNICTDCAKCTRYVNGYYCEALRCVVYPQVNPLAYRFCHLHEKGIPMDSEERILRLTHYDGYDPQYQGA